MLFVVRSSQAKVNPGRTATAHQVERFKARARCSRAGAGKGVSCIFVLNFSCNAQLNAPILLCHPSDAYLYVHLCVLRDQHCFTIPLNRLFYRWSVLRYSANVPHQSGRRSKGIDNWLWTASVDGVVNGWKLNKKSPKHIKIATTIRIGSKRESGKGVYCMELFGDHICLGTTHGEIMMITLVRC